MQRQHLRMDREGDMGIGTLIMFIAVVLVAAIAAALLIQSAIVLKEDGERIQHDAITYVTSGITVIDVVGDRQIYGKEPYDLSAYMDPGEEFVGSGGKGIMITWKNPAGVSVTGFNIYRDTEQDTKRLLYSGQNEGEVTQFIDTGNQMRLKPYTTYFYRVSVFNGSQECGLSEPAAFYLRPFDLNTIRNAGNNKGAEVTIEFPTRDETASRPIVVTAEFVEEPGGTGVVINWSNPELDSDLTGFRIFRGETSSKVSLLHTSTTSAPIATFTDAGNQLELLPGKYYYKVTALTNHGSTLPSRAVSVTLTTTEIQAISGDGGNTGAGGETPHNGSAAAPELTNLFIGANGVNLIWSTSMIDVDAVTIFRSDDDGTSYHRIYNSSNSRDPDINHFIDSGAQRLFKTGYADYYIIQTHNQSVGWSRQLLVPTGGLSEEKLWGIINGNSGHSAATNPSMIDRSNTRPLELAVESVGYNGVTLSWRYPLGVEYPIQFEIYRGTSINAERQIFISNTTTGDNTDKYVDDSLYGTWSDRGDQLKLEAGTYYYRVSFSTTSGMSMASLSVKASLSKIELESISTNRGSTGANLLRNDIQVLKIKIMLRPGSRNITLENTQIAIYTGREDMHLFLDNSRENPSGIMTFRGESLRDPANIFTREKKYTISPGTLVVLYINVGETGLNLKLSTQTYVKLKILPSTGVKSIEEFTTPEVYVGRYVLLEE